MRVAIAADHNGTALRADLVRWLAAEGYEVDDRGGASGPDAAVDYPALCADVCAEVVAGRAERGIVLGGSGLGETVACNKIRGIRAGLCHDEWSAGISRGNNDANVLVLSAKTLPADAARRVAATWLTTAFKGGVHARRLAQIEILERGGELG
ncbi:RpiB/LacA/LacB family sugar-phosphate isomerase [Streptomyces fuscigenes]|uniref:RpiB/LacA/LacB family sugar-phosphate isomerase n=1 Tax=Streptomyces fuscigenes TaxID=1528880 RepID=UPI001F180347|nr:RpiB/LacA/LacB family sugar-phosphate isomerase [Streptomyces fuscigenes]MCF3962157.1 RpiB/LacA/LacB family sugar-phosphate isomerase [Streptomyces fuscigenes]